MVMDPPVEVEHKPASPVERKIAEMLLENTGSHFLDSGGAYGRAWQHERARLGLDGGLPNSAFHGGPTGNPADPTVDEIEHAVRAFRADPEATVDRYGSLGLSPFHFLVGRLDYDPVLDRKFSLYCMIRDAGKDRWDRESWYEQKELWLDALEQRGVIMRGSRHGDNSYNHECALDRTIQYDTFMVENDSTGRWVGDDWVEAHEILPDGAYVMLQIHGGADVRGGYTKPVLFRLGGDDTYDLLDYSGRGAGASCPGSDPNPDVPDGQATLDGEPVSHEGEDHRWYIEDSYYRRFEDPDGSGRVLVFRTASDLEDIAAIERGEPNYFYQSRPDQEPEVRDPRKDDPADVDVAVIEDITQGDEVVGYRWMCQRHNQPLSIWGPYPGS